MSKSICNVGLDLYDFENSVSLEEWAKGESETEIGQQALIIFEHVLKNTIIETVSLQEIGGRAFGDRSESYTEGEDEFSVFVISTSNPVVHLYVIISDTDIRLEVSKKTVNAQGIALMLGWAWGSLTKVIKELENEA